MRYLGMLLLFWVIGAFTLALGGAFLAHKRSAGVLLVMFFALLAASALL